MSNTWLAAPVTSISAASLAAQATVNTDFNLRRMASEPEILELMFSVTFGGSVDANYLVEILGMVDEATADTEPVTSFEITAENSATKVQSIVVENRSMVRVAITNNDSTDAVTHTLKYRTAEVH